MIFELRSTFELEIMNWIKSNSLWPGLEYRYGCSFARDTFLLDISHPELLTNFMLRYGHMVIEEI